MARTVESPAPRVESPPSLPRQGEAPSFEAQSVTRDVHPRSVLDGLARLGLARHDPRRDTAALGPSRARPIDTATRRLRGAAFPRSISMQHPLRDFSVPSRWRVRVAAGLLALLSACGGGSELAGVGTGGTGSFAVGPISGFGSIVVNGVHYDDSTASVFDDDGNPSNLAALQLGMVVEVRGSINADGATGSASSFTFAAEIKGPVTAVDVNAGTLRVLDRSVKVTPTTLFAGVGSLAGLAVGNVVEVHGLPDADGRVTATRIELEAASVAAFGGEFRVRGTMGPIAGSAPNWRFTVAGVAVTTDAATRIDGTPAAGAQASVRLDKIAAADGSYRALRVQTSSRGFDDGVSQSELEGLVSDLATPGAAFKVDGYPVQLGASVIYENGVAADLANGVRVEVEGDVVAGVLSARKVEFKHEDADGGSDGGNAPFEFKGVARCSPSPCAVPAGAFVVQGVTVQYDASTRFDDGASPATLDGARVEVKAVAVAGANGSAYRATRIEPAN